MKCPKCSKNIDNISKYCQHCGAELTKAVKKSIWRKQWHEMSRGEKNTLVGITAVVILLIIIGVIVGISYIKKSLDFPQPRILKIDGVNSKSDKTLLNVGVLGITEDVLVRIQNTGGAGRVEVTLLLDGSLVESKVVDFAKDESRDVYFYGVSYTYSKNKQEREFSVDLKIV